jgi:tetratricopeptide (TPR) repeat protein
MNLNNLGMFAALQQEFARARDHFETSLEVSRKLGDPQAVAHTLCGLASALLELGEVDEAENHLRESLTVAEDAQATPVVLEALLGMADVYCRRGQMQLSGRLMGLVEAHPATESELRDISVPKLRKRLTPALSPNDLKRLAAEGASTDLARGVLQALGKPPLG